MKHHKNQGAAFVALTCTWYLNADELLEQMNIWFKDNAQPRPQAILCGKPATELNEDSPVCAEHHAEFLRRLNS